MSATSENQLTGYRVPEIPFPDEIRTEPTLLENLRRDGFSDLQIDSIYRRLMIEKQFLADSGFEGLLENFYLSHFGDSSRLDGYGKALYCYNLFPYFNFKSNKKELQSISMLDLIWREDDVAKKASAGVVCGNFVWGHFSESRNGYATSDFDVLQSAMRNSTEIKYPLSKGYFMDETLFDAAKWNVHFALERDFGQFHKGAGVYPNRDFLNNTIIFN